MKLLHFAMSALGGYGETFVDLSLADQLADGGIESHFVITAGVEPLFASGKHPYSLIDADPELSVQAVVEREMSEHQPDAVILADYANFWGHMLRNAGDDPWFIEKYGVPLIPIDMWEWENSGFAYDFCGRGFGREYDRHILDMPAHLRPVPVCHVDAGDSRRGHPYRLTAPEPARAAAVRNQVFDDLGLSAADRLVLLPISAWQQPTTSTRLITEMTVRLGQRVPELLARYLGALPDRTHVLVVGAVPEALRQLPAGRLHELGPCPPDRYRDLLRSADLMVSLTMSGLTLARATLMGTPGMLLTNRFTVADAEDIDRVDAALGGLADPVRSWLSEVAPTDAFSHWPKGIHTFIEPLVRDNPYLTAMAHEELFDQRTVVGRMREILYDPAARERLAESRDAYIAMVDALPPTWEVFGAAAAKVGLRV
jgi:hypothetical protein